jgi:hypothetical protein
MRSTSFHCSPDGGRPARPLFSSSKTADRLRESERGPSILSPGIKPRISVFTEEGLEDLNGSVHPSSPNTRRDSASPIQDQEETRGEDVPFDQLLKGAEHKREEESKKKLGSSSWYSKRTKGSRPRIKSSATSPPSTFATISRATMLVLLIAVVIPGLRYSVGRDKVNIYGADAGVITRAELVENGSAIEGRQNTATDICTRWAHMGIAKPSPGVGLDTD